MKIRLNHAASIVKNNKRNPKHTENGVPTSTIEASNKFKNENTDESLALDRSRYSM
jgi:hypothetical protein